MTGQDASRREQARAVFFSLIMVVSMIAIGGAAFAGSATADVSGSDGLQNPTATNISVGSETVTQTVSVDVISDDSAENVTIDAYGQSNLETSDVVSATASADDSLTVESNAVVDSGDVKVNVSGNSTTNNIDGTLTVDITYNTTGIATQNGATITIDDENTGNDADSVTTNFDLTAPDSITVTPTNGNGLQYVVNNVAEDGTVTVESGVTYNGNLKIPTEGVTVEGPNAGIGGNSSDRVEEAVINGVVTIGQTGSEYGNVTVDGFTVEAAPDDTLSPADEGVFMIGERGFLDGDNVIKNNIITADDGNDDNSVVYGAYLEGNPNLELTFENNLFNETGSGFDNTGAIRQTGSPISSLNITGNTIRTEGSIALTADGDVTADISGNEFTDVIDGSFAEVFINHLGGDHDVDIVENNFNSGTGPGIDLDGNFDVSDSGSDSVKISSNNFEETSITAVDADEVTGAVDATSNWWDNPIHSRIVGPYTPQNAESQPPIPRRVYSYTRLHTEGQL